MYFTNNKSIFKGIRLRNIQISEIQSQYVDCNFFLLLPLCTAEWLDFMKIPNGWRNIHEP